MYIPGGNRLIFSRKITLIGPNSERDIEGALRRSLHLTDLPGPCLGLCVGVACFVVFGGFVVGFFLLGKFDLNHMLIPVVDRPCLALVRQCREKKRGALRRRFSDLVQDNFGIGQVHLSYYLTEPVADPGWSIQLVLPIVEDDDTPVVLFKAVLSTYKGLGAIYVPPVLHKNILITETDLDIVCGPQGKLCACYHNGFHLRFARLEVADLDFISCWLAEDDTLTGASEVRAMVCDGSNQPRLGSRAWARS